MSNTIGRFSYKIVAPKKGDEISFSPFVHIVPKRYVKDAEEWPLLSPNLVTEGEIDRYIQDLKDDLDHVGPLAKRALRNAKERP